MLAAHKIKENGEGGLSALDLFSPPVSLTFKGQRTFKTTFGGITSIICYAIVFLIMVLKTQELLGKPEEAAHYMTDTVSEDEAINLHKLKFAFALN